MTHIEALTELKNIGENIKAIIRCDTFEGGPSPGTMRYLKEIIHISNLAAIELKRMETQKNCDTCKWGDDENNCVNPAPENIKCDSYDWQLWEPKK